MCCWCWTQQHNQCKNYRFWQHFFFFVRFSFLFVSIWNFLVRYLVCREKMRRRKSVRFNWFFISMREELCANMSSVHVRIIEKKREEKQSFFDCKIDFKRWWWWRWLININIIKSVRFTQQPKQRNGESESKNHSLIVGKRRIENHFFISANITSLPTVWYIIVMPSIFHPTEWNRQRQSYKSARVR